jgi:hypothetical protein
VLPGGDAVQFDVRTGSVQRDVAPVWELVEARIRSDAVYAPSFDVLLAIAGVIGAVGVALGLDQRARRPVLRGLLALLAGFSAAMVLTLLLGLAIRWSEHTPTLYSKGVRPVSDLINNPNLFSVIVAVLAGIAGVVSLTEARAGALIGVFISVTTIPPLPTWACPWPIPAGARPGGRPSSCCSTWPC